MYKYLTTKFQYKLLIYCVIFVLNVKKFQQAVIYRKTKINEGSEYMLYKVSMKLKILIYFKFINVLYLVNCYANVIFLKSFLCHAKKNQ